MKTQKKLVPEGKVTITKFDSEESKSVRLSLGIKDENGFPCLEVHSLNGEVVLAVNVSQEVYNSFEG